MTRPLNRLLAFVLGVGLFAGGVFVVIETVATWTGDRFLWIPGRQWLSTFKTTPWSATLVIAVGAAVGALGLVVFILQVFPRRHRVVTYRTDGTGTWLLLRRSTERRLQRRLTAHVAQARVKARLTPKSRRWTLRVKAKTAPSARPTLQSASQAELADLHAPDKSLVRVSTTGDKRVS